MRRCLVLTELCLISCLKFTLVTGIFDTFVFSLLVSLKIRLCCCLIFTFVTRKYDTIMLTADVKTQSTPIPLTIKLLGRYSYHCKFSTSWYVVQFLVYFFSLQVHSVTKFSRNLIDRIDRFPVLSNTILKLGGERVQD